MASPYTGVIPDKAVAEIDDLKHAISEFHSAWTLLENQLSNLLNAILGYDKTKTRMAFAVFYAPTSMETQLTLLDDCLNLLVREHAYDLRIIAIWSAISDRIVKCKKDRNFIAHSSIHVFKDGEEKFARLTSPITNITSWSKAPTAHRSWPGYGTRELNAKHQRVIGVSDMVLEYAQFIYALTANDGTSQEKFQKLESRHPLKGRRAPTSGQSPLTQLSQPESSRE